MDKLYGISLQLRMGYEIIDWCLNTLCVSFWLKTSVYSYTKDYHCLNQCCLSVSRWIYFTEIKSKGRINTFKKYHWTIKFCHGFKKKVAYIQQFSISLANFKQKIYHFLYTWQKQWYIYRECTSDGWRITEKSRKVTFSLKSCWKQFTLSKTKITMHTEKHAHFTFLCVYLCFVDLLIFFLVISLNLGPQDMTLSLHDFS